MKMWAAQFRFLCCATVRFLCVLQIFYAREFRKQLDKSDTYLDLCSLLCEMMEQFNVRVILDGLDELEDRLCPLVLF